MRIHERRIIGNSLAAAILLVASATVGCGGSSKSSTDGAAGSGGGNGGAGGAGGVGGGAGMGGTGGAGGGIGGAGGMGGGGMACDMASGCALTPNTPPTDPGAKGILFTTSGEVLALGGYSYPPPTVDDPAFADGWEIKFTRMIATFDHVTISENPDKSPSDQSMTDAAVARVDGPWAVDLHKGGPLMGKGGTDEQSVAFAAVKNQNLKGGSAFDDTRRYAFSFDAIAATGTALNVNLDADGLKAYGEMAEKGYVLLVDGIATWKGGSCSSTDPKYDFSKWPKTVNFHFGFKTPTTYLNCQNPDNDPADPFAGEEHQRGLAVKTSASVIAQVTFHTDHSFWESFEHDSPAHFDQFAAKYSTASGTPTAKLEDFVGADFQPFKDAAGSPVPWRSCLTGYMPPTMGAMSFDTKGVPVSKTGTADKAIRDFYDYEAYNTSTLGHLNSDGLCYVKRNYPSPL